MYKITKYMEEGDGWSKIKSYRYDSKKIWEKRLQIHKDGVNGLRFKFISESLMVPSGLKLIPGIVKELKVKTF